MRPRALVVKYMPDLKRRESRNIGVVVTDGERTLSRFIGEDEEGRLKPLYAVPRIFESRRTYRSWWNHWRRSLETGLADPEQLAEILVPPASTSNYLCELAAVEMAGERAPLRRFLNEMWAALISLEEIRRDQDSDDDIVEITDRLVLPYARRPEYTVYQDRSLSVRHTRNGITWDATLHFHYMVQNGHWSHMRRLKLSTEDTRTWDRVHLTVRTFEGLDESTDASHRDSVKVVLVQASEDNDDADKQMLELERGNVMIVPLDNEDEAAERLGELIG